MLDQGYLYITLCRDTVGEGSILSSDVVGDPKGEVLEVHHEPAFPPSHEVTVYIGGDQLHATQSDAYRTHGD
jgi:hypothetical protein